ncbi:MAG TPA: hypothetical protein VHQ48_04070 [Bradyrhizobium sp.]|nr:hypothetical protein [Bradyrhizobium sp.]
MYSRADLSRTVAVVALFLTAISTSAAAREFRAADTRNEDYPTVQALRYMGRLIAEKSDGRLQIRVFPTGIYAKVQRDPAAAALIERIRKVE